MLGFLCKITGMFTGLIEEKGRIKSIDKTSSGIRFGVLALFASDLALGESVAVNGVCLTVAECAHDFFEAEVIPASLEVTTLGDLVAGVEVNLERALKVGDRLGGHFLQGHVDGIGKVIRVTGDDSGHRLEIAPPAPLLKYLALKGSVVVDGVSLTVSAVSNKYFEVALVPHTLDSTTLGGLREGGRVNLEVDLLARYLEQLNRSS